MQKYRATIIFLFIFINAVSGQNLQLSQAVEDAMLGSTRYMVEEVSYNGGYVWHYLPDFSRRWGEMEAYETMIWLQHPGTISMGHLFLDAYRATGNEYFYEATDKAARAVIWGQSKEGGWNYMIDFAGDRSLKKWYETIGKNGWRLEEFQHYYGNSTFDDNITSDATRFLLRMYLEKLDPTYKYALDKAIDFVLKSQYEIGGWPQRFPLMDEFSKHGNPDYSSYYTFNDEVIYENINLLIQCYVTLGEERYLDPIMKGINFMYITQQENGAWGMQYNMDLEPSGARTYEPKAYSTAMTFENASFLLKFYRLTGDPRFPEAVAKALQWLNKVTVEKEKTEDGRFTHPAYIDVEKGTPIYVHRKGSNVKYGYYYFDQNDNNLLGHSRGKTNLNLAALQGEYDKIISIPPDEITRNSPLMPGTFEGNTTPQKYYDLNLFIQNRIPDEDEVRNIIDGLDSQMRWMSKNVRISNPYIGGGKNEEKTDRYASTRVGDSTDTSPYDNTSDQQYISTREYIDNMRLLINYLESKPTQRQSKE